jgi:hypothetical protein
MLLKPTPSKSTTDTTTRPNPDNQAQPRPETQKTTQKKAHAAGCSTCSLNAALQKWPSPICAPHPKCSRPVVLGVHNPPGFQHLLLLLMLHTHHSGPSSSSGHQSTLASKATHARHSTARVSPLHCIRLQPTASHSMLLHACSPQHTCSSHTFTQPLGELWSESNLWLLGLKASSTVHSCTHIHEDTHTHSA